MITRLSSPFSPSREKIPQENLHAAIIIIIFAASNLKRGQNAAGTLPAIFVPSLYRNHCITMPCRVSGNRPGASAFKSLTARSMVTFLCQNLNVMQTENRMGSPLGACLGENPPSFPMFSTCPQDAGIDEIGLRPLHGLYDGHHLGGGVEPVELKFFSQGNAKKITKCFDGTNNNIIFAASKHYCGQNAAGYRPAIFVPPLYRNHRITAPCRESGNRPGVLAIMYSTARSAVTFLCQNIIVMQRKQIAFPFTLLSWRETSCRILAMLCHSLEKLQDWKESENAWFSALCEERVTNQEVAAVAAGVCVGLPAILCIAGLVLEGGAL